MISAWLIGYSVAALCVVIAAHRVKPLALLAACFALIAAMFLLLPDLGELHYLIAGLTDLIMALLCIVFWCEASRRTAQLAIIAMLINFVMHAWYRHPWPYGAFMFAYDYYPDAIRGIELGQLLILLYWTPAIQRLARRLTTTKQEPPCQRILIARP